MKMKCGTPKTLSASFCGDNGSGNGCMKTILDPAPQDCSGPSGGYHCYTYQVPATRYNYTSTACLPECDCSCDDWDPSGEPWSDVSYAAYNDDTACHK